jgi:hypothetical protein
LIRLSHWITTSRRKRTARGSSAKERPTLNLSIRDTTSLKAMEMVVTPMAIGAMVETRETLPMDITMETMVTRMEEMEITMVITMETVVSTTTTQKLRRISLISHASSARRRDTNKSDEPAKPNPFKKGYVNQINVEDVMGTFPFNSFTALDFI